MRNIIGQPVTGTDFFERPRLIKKIRKAMEARLPIFLSGPARSGKTSTLFYLRDKLDENDKLVFINAREITNGYQYYYKIFEELGGLEGEVKGEDITLSFVPSIGELESYYKNLYKKLTKTQDDIIKLLINYKGAKPQVIMIDDFSGVLVNIINNEGTEEAVHFLEKDRKFRSDLDNYIGNVRLIYTSSIDMETIASILNASQIIGDLSPFKLLPLSEEDAENFLKALTENTNFALEPDHVRYLCQKIRWLNPYHIQLIIFELDNILIDQELSVISSSTIDEALKRASMHEDFSDQTILDGPQKIKKELKKIKIQHLKIQNIKCFKNVDINFEAAGNTAVITGTNGKGKSTILQLLALGMNGISNVPFPSNWKEVVKKNHDRGFFEIDALYNDNPIHLKFEINAKDDSITCTEGKDHLESMRDTFMLLAYGVNRSIKLEETRPYKAIEPIATLFGENGYLKHIKISSTYEYVNQNFETIRELINKVLEKANNENKVILTRFDSSSFYFKTPSNPGEDIPIEALSEGFKSTLVWLLDAIIRIVEKGGSLESSENITGIIMLDEVDLHLHPSWQRTILQSIETLFPNIRFIVTTHSPFVVQSTGIEALIPLEMEKGSDNVIVMDKGITSELSYSAIVDEIFNIPFPFSREIEQEMDKFREMANALRDNKKIDEKQFKRLVMDIAGRGVELEGIMRRELMNLQRRTGKTFDLWKK